MADVRLHLAPSELDEYGENVRMLHQVHSLFENGENSDPYEFYGDLTVVVDHCNAILEWVSRVRTSLASRGVAA